MKNIQTTILQSKNVDYILNTLGTEVWIQVCGNMNLNGANAGFWCGLIDPSLINRILSDPSWEISYYYQSVPGFEEANGECVYKTNLLGDGLESLLYHREFYGVKPNYVELSQEFILLNNLRFDLASKSYFAMYDDGETEEAVRYKDNITIEIKTKYLKKYAAAKQMALVLFFDIRTKFDGCLSNYGLKEFSSQHKTNSLYYELWGGDFKAAQEYAYSALMGKKIFMPAPVEKCGYWPYEKEKSYEKFIIGVDENGDNVYYSCDPNGLGNYYGANPGAPMYLTPIYFKREVLKKYIDKPELYDVKDGHLWCKGLWNIEIDNHHKNCVCAYLGDLGRDLPENEQSHWKSYNIIGEEGISPVSFQRDFLCMPTDSNMPDHRFQLLFKEVSEGWKEKYGWELFLPLSPDDEYNYTHLHLPLSESQPEFDQQVLSLVKTLIDSLNEKELKKVNGCNTSVSGSINRFSEWLKANNAIDFEEHICFLRDLQDLRSSGTGHRKGANYNKIATKFGLNEKNTIDVFEDILKKAIAVLEYLKETFLQQ